MAKNWVFTINNPTDDDVPSTWEYKYVVWQVERGAEGTRHLQGYVQMLRQHKLTGMKKVHSTAHWEVRKGTHSEAREYAMKESTREDGPWEHGTPNVVAGQRNDLLAYRDAVKQGTAPADIVNDDMLYPVMAKYRHLRSDILMALNLDARDWMTELHIRWGVSGSGKSHWAREAHPGAFWLSPPREKGVWWDGYRGQETVIIDEFKGWIPQHIIKRLADKYPFQVETKGGVVPFVAKRIILLSNFDPSGWWTSGLEDATKRRITSCEQWTAVYGVDPVPVLNEVDAWGRHVWRYPHNPEAPIN